MTLFTRHADDGRLRPASGDSGTFLTPKSPADRGGVCSVYFKKGSSYSLTPKHNRYKDGLFYCFERTVLANQLQYCLREIKQQQHCFFKGNKQQRSAGCQEGAPLLAVRLRQTSLLSNWSPWAEHQTWTSFTPHLARSIFLKKIYIYTSCLVVFF